MTFARAPPQGDSLAVLCRRAQAQVNKVSRLSTFKLMLQLQQGAAPSLSLEVHPARPSCCCSQVLAEVACVPVLEASARQLAASRRLCKSQSSVSRPLGLHLEMPPARAAVRHAIPPAGLPRPPSETSSAGQSAASVRTTLIHDEAEAESAPHPPPTEQGAAPDGPAVERQQSAPRPKEGGMVSRWRRRMGTDEQLPDVLTQEPQVAQALAPPQTPPPVEAEVCMALPALPAC